MINLDKVKIGIDVDYLKRNNLKIEDIIILDLNEEYYHNNILLRNGEEITNKLTLKNEYKYAFSNTFNELGVHGKEEGRIKEISIHLDMFGEVKKIVIELSAKILKDRYFEGINLNNIHEVCDLISEKNGVLKIIDKEKFIQLAKVYTVEVSKTLILDNPVSKYIDIFNFHRSNSKYDFKKYKHGGLRIRNDEVKDKVFFTLYDKMSRIRSQKEYYLLNDFNRDKNVLKIEHKFNKFKVMREFLDIDKEVITLYDVLHSKTSPVYDFLNELIQEGKAPSCEKSFKSYVEYLGYKELYRICNNNLQSCKSLIKLKNKGTNTSYYMKKLISSISSVRDVKSPLLTELKEKLVA